MNRRWPVKSAIAMCCTQRLSQKATSPTSQRHRHVSSVRVLCVGQEVEQHLRLVRREAVETDRVLRVHEQGLATRLGVDPHDGMALHPLGVVARVHDHARERVVDALHLRRVRVDRAVDADEPVEHRLHALRQARVRRVLVGPHRVAAVGRYLERVQDRRERRLGQEREVGVPQAAERVVLALLGLAHHRDHLGVPGDRLDERHRAVRAEPARGTRPARRASAAGRGRRRPGGRGRRGGSPRSRRRPRRRARGRRRRSPRRTRRRRARP